MTTIGSLVLGVAAWVLPICGLTEYGKRAGGFSAASFAACALALLLQIFYFHGLSARGDWSAVEDTSRAVALVSAVLTAVTALLNGALWALRRRRLWEKKERGGS